MVITAAKLCKCIFQLRRSVSQLCVIRSASSLHTLEETVKTAIEAKSYQQIPEFLNSGGDPRQNHNPFIILSTFSHDHKTQIVDEMLQSFISVRPRSRLQNTYNSLISFILQSPNPLPLALAVLQRILRSGCIPVPQVQLFLSNAWLEHRHRKCYPVQDILLEMRTIGYHPDCGTCNYLISSLCSVDQLDEGVRVLKGMIRAGCIPDSETYDTLVKAMCKIRKTTDAIEMLNQMVLKVGLTPRQGTVVKVAAALRANREARKAVQMIEFLENEGLVLAFESYELVVKVCLECQELILAGKMVMAMTGKGFIPHIKVRQKVVEDLAGVNEWKLACVVRQRFVELGS